MGREFGLDALARLGKLPPDELLRGARRGHGRALVGDVPGSPGRLRFGHALIRDTLYDELTAARRLRLHQKVGEALEAVYAADSSLISPSWRTTSSPLPRPGRPQGSRVRPSRRRQGRLPARVRGGRAPVRHGARARRACSGAATRRRPAGTPASRAVDSHPPRRVVATIDRALGLLDSDEDRAHAQRCSRPRRVPACSRFAATRRRGSPRKRWRGAPDRRDPRQSAASTVLGPSLSATGDVDARAAALREALDLARTNDLSDGLGRAFWTWPDLLLLQGRADEALEVARAGPQEAEERGQGHRRDWLQLLIAERVRAPRLETAGRTIPSPERRQSATRSSLLRLASLTSAVATRRPPARSCDAPPARHGLDRAAVRRPARRRARRAGAAGRGPGRGAPSRGRGARPVEHRSDLPRSPSSRAPACASGYAAEHARERHKPPPRPRHASGAPAGRPGRQASLREPVGGARLLAAADAEQARRRGALCPALERHRRRLEAARRPIRPPTPACASQRRWPRRRPARRARAARRRSTPPAGSASLARRRAGRTRPRAHPRPERAIPQRPRVRRRQLPRTHLTRARGVAPVAVDATCLEIGGRSTCRRARSPGRDSRHYDRATAATRAEPRGTDPECCNRHGRDSPTAGRDLASRDGRSLSAVGSASLSMQSTAAPALGENPELSRWPLRLRNTKWRTRVPVVTDAVTLYVPTPKTRPQPPTEDVPLAPKSLTEPNRRVLLAKRMAGQALGLINHRLGTAPPAPDPKT